MNKELVNFLASHSDLKTDASFKDITTIKIGGKIEYLVYPYDLQQLLLILRYLNEKKLNYHVLGRGSNLVCGDETYEGCIIRLDHLDEYNFEDNYVYAQAGVPVMRLAKVLASQSLSGLEFASGIPGSIGGLVYMNAGAYKKCMADIVISVDVLIDNEIKTLSLEECEYSYRTSIFQKHPELIILAAKLKVEDGKREDILKLMEDRLIRRKETQPLEMPSAGSCYRNPEGDFAWRLIDGVGLRGYRYNGIQISEKHPNFIVNVGEATYTDFMVVNKTIVDRVKNTYGVELLREVELFNC